jgi:cation:H+ antiporter
VKKRNGLSVGNIIGSNIFDTLIPIGVAGALSTLRFDPRLLRSDLPFLIGLSCLVIIFFARKRGLQKQEAIILQTLYCTYAVIRISNA